MDLLQKFCDIISEFLGEGHKTEGLLVKRLLDMGDADAALVKFEELAKNSNTLHYLPDLVKEFTIEEDRGRMQRLLDATIQVRREEGALYTFARIFLEMGKTSQARTLLKAPGLR